MLRMMELLLMSTKMNWQKEVPRGKRRVFTFTNMATQMSQPSSTQHKFNEDLIISGTNKHNKALGKFKLIVT